MTTPRVGVSACLLGQPVRWDGRDKREALLTDVLARHLELVPVCPEVGAGMGVPREPVQLLRVGDDVRLRGVTSGRDWTRALTRWARAELVRLGPLAGFVLKARSPSCGARAVPIFDEAGVPRDAGAGLFAAALARALPDLPTIDETALHDRAARDAWLAAVHARAGVPVPAALVRDERTPQGPEGP